MLGGGATAEGSGPSEPPAVTRLLTAFPPAKLRVPDAGAPQGPPRECGHVSGCQSCRGPCTQKGATGPAHRAPRAFIPSPSQQGGSVCCRPGSQLRGHTLGMCLLLTPLPPCSEPPDSHCKPPNWSPSVPWTRSPFSTQTQQRPAMLFLCLPPSDFPQQPE